MDSNNSFLPIFSAVGIEIEYMIVNQTDLNIMPVSDRILEHFAGEITNETALGEIAISNELVKHVLEFKTNGPKPFSPDLHKTFHAAIRRVNDFLQTQNARLLPTGIHPWFDPASGVDLWPHGDKRIYACYNSIFDCRGHGWSNLQSMHINLPFANDQEFKKLHGAIRVLLPFIPALTASSPFVEGRKSKYLDARLNFYQDNQKKIPHIAGHIIPEHVTSAADYEDLIFKPLYRAIAPFDPDGILQFEWLNSRGAIARFDRMAIEIRVIDTQECPKADISHAYLIQQFLKFIITDTDAYLSHPINESDLKKTFVDCMEHGSKTVIDNLRLLSQTGMDFSKPVTAREFWLCAIDRLHGEYLDDEIYDSLKLLVQNGNLAERITRSTGSSPSSTVLFNTYKRLADCLANNEFFTG